MVRTRRNVTYLPAGDKTLEWFGKAILQMQAKPFADPTSWRYQAAIHDYDRASDPLAVPGDILPPASQQTKYWKQCQHGSYYFLPWHRMYLHFFEQIALRHIVALGGPSDWALPYWNYSASSAASLLPVDFRSPTLPDGTQNPLFVQDREPNANSGLQFASSADTDLSYCLTRSKFSGAAVGGSSGFGGPVTVFHHSGGSIGALERTPHGAMHNAVGGLSGWMGAFSTAPLDPIFWLHHCNIDRLWEVWLKRDPAHQNPSTPNWLTSVPFDFHDAAGTAVTMTPTQVVSTQAMPLEYEYDDTSDPLGVSPANLAVHRGHIVMGGSMSPPIEEESEVPPEMVGASTASFGLDRGPKHQDIQLQKPTGPGAKTAGTLFAKQGTTPRRVFLQIEGITARERVMPYDVYVNLPPNAGPAQMLAWYAGRLPMFGVPESSLQDANHPGNGVSYTLEITDLYHRLLEAGKWDEKNLRVSFLPTRTDCDVSATVGRISIYFA